jgi:hypothetical protein
MKDSVRSACTPWVISNRGLHYQRGVAPLPDPVADARKAWWRFRRTPCTHDSLFELSITHRPTNAADRLRRGIPGRAGELQVHQRSGRRPVGRTALCGTLPRHGRKTALATEQVSVATGVTCCRTEPRHRVAAALLPRHAIGSRNRRTTPVRQPTISTDVARTCGPRRGSRKTGEAQRELERLASLEPWYG